VHLGILLDLGTRDENLETTGSLLSIKNTYMKTVLNTNETVNYGMVQMAGGEFNMDYDQETTYFGAHCLSHDVVDILNMMADCALEPRSVTASSVILHNLSLIK
jgi:predicted Zn-dependent peptidase